MARRPASRKPSPVIAAITVANFVRYSMRLYTHSRKKDSRDHRMAAASPFLVFCRALPCAQFSPLQCVIVLLINKCAEGSCGCLPGSRHHSSC